MEGQNTGFNGFREAAIRKQKAGEQFTSLLVLVGTRGWMSLVAIALLLFAGIYWILTASIPVQVSGHGILLSSGRIATIPSPCTGTVSEILVLEGDTLEYGDCLALIEVADSSSPCSILCSSRASLEAVQVHQGKTVQKGDILFTLKAVTPVDSVLQAVVFFSPEDGQRIQIGMNANLDPASTNRDDYGYMPGHVTSVSPIPVNADEIADQTGNSTFADLWTGLGPQIQVSIGLFPDSSTDSGYRWSSRTGPDITLHTGTLCECEVILTRQKPIQLILRNPSQHNNTEDL